MATSPAARAGEIPGSGSLAQRLKLASGLVLFAFIATHLLNHSAGLISVDVMEAIRGARVLVWRSLPGTVLLYGAMATHVGLVLWKFTHRRSWRFTLPEAVQLVFGLAIPIFLLRHVIGTRLAHELYGIQDNYDYALWAMWPGEAWRQFALIFLAWIHACIGLHYWLRMKSWYRRFVWALYGAAVLVPVLAFAGFSVAGRAARQAGGFENPFRLEENLFLAEVMDYAFWGFIAMLAMVLAARFTRMAIDRIRPRIRVTYPGGRSVVSETGPTLLEISQANGIPHAAVCGGRARCSTCRVRVLAGLEHQPEAQAAEQRVLARIGAGRNVRLACQLRPSADIAIAPLLPAHSASVRSAAIQDKYAWGVEQNVAVMFVDIRRFTTLSEDKLPYDVVFILNQYLGQMSDAITDANGYVDKFIGDGIMAIFGMDSDPQTGARNALLAARAMDGVLDALNISLAGDLPHPLEIGIGIHLGPAILGRIGVTGTSNGITALGDTVNTASRLESATKDLRVQLVISAHTAMATGLDFSAFTEESVSVKGKATPIKVYAFRKAMLSPQHADLSKADA